MILCNVKDSIRNKKHNKISKIYPFALFINFLWYFANERKKLKIMEVFEVGKETKMKRVLNQEFDDVILVTTFPITPELMLVSQTSPHDA